MPVDYEQIIDSLVDRRDSVVSERVKNANFWPSGSAKAKFNSLVANLSDEGRALLAELLQSERDSGIHDALVVLSELMNLDALRFCVNGTEIAHEPYGTELYYDWSCRVAGDPWPNKDKI